MTVRPTGIDAVLQVPPPDLSAAEACWIGRAAFGIEAAGARSLGSERDQAFLLTGAAGPGIAALKVSNPAEDPAMLDIEARAAFHAVRRDPGLTVALPRRPVQAGDEPSAGGDGVSGLRVRWKRDGTACWVRATTCCPAGPGWIRRRCPTRR